MSEFDNRFFIKEKGYRNGVYGQIITRVDNAGTPQEKRSETFHPIAREVLNESAHETSEK